MSFFRSTLILLFLAISSLARASESENFVETAQSLVKAGLEQKFPGARIEFTGPLNWKQGVAPTNHLKLISLAEEGRGLVQFSFSEETEEPGQIQIDGTAAFSAWVPARMPIRRIMPGERLTSEILSDQDVNVASGTGYTYRGVVLPQTVELSNLEARQTLLEGQFVVTTAVQKVPDIRRGDSVQILVKAGLMSVLTQGTAQESAYVNKPVRVLTVKTKRELVGKLDASGTVEVTL